ncbi:hypothetical protein [Prosthecobacter dejongeii]|uniref:Putative nucleic acid-binding Zn-ribbon protein n=1 Tax=Prosthecobacter dejongeii TaxID=48465 RepID=A0A7W7YID6_9BACT|nr:hypothetical protein [Prosthecobacter dejongeii]MBB5036656.1 putative nucleic acid-binding Zn-ribbon protein [Prosthecobacter dejongeii]
MATEQEFKNWLQASTDNVTHYLKGNIENQKITPAQMQNVLMKTAQDLQITPTAEQIREASERMMKAADASNVHVEKANEWNAYGRAKGQEGEQHKQQATSLREALQNEKNTAGWQRKSEVSELGAQLNHAKYERAQAMGHNSAAMIQANHHQELRQTAFAEEVMKGLVTPNQARFSQDTFDALIAAQNDTTYKGKDYTDNLKNLAKNLADEAVGGNSVDTERAVFEAALIEKLEIAPAKQAIAELDAKLEVNSSAALACHEALSDPHLSPLKEADLLLDLEGLQQEAKDLKEEKADHEVTLRVSGARLETLQQKMDQPQLQTALRADAANAELQADLLAADPSDLDRGQQQRPARSGIVLGAARPQPQLGGSSSSSDLASEPEKKEAKQSTRENAGLSNWTSAKPSPNAIQKGQGL